jgi:hypothetical protein
MSLIERLEERARELDRLVRDFDMSNYGRVADDRELMLEAAKRLKWLEDFYDR